MALISTGVFPVNQIVFKVDTAYGKTGSPDFVTIADMETASISIDTGVENWNSITENGWQKSLVTAKALTLSMSGKRNFGDAGNDYIASKWNKLGQEANTTVQVTFPNGDMMEFKAVVSITDFLGADSTNVAPLGFDLISDGEPIYTEAVA